MYQCTALKNLSPAIQEKSEQDALLDLTRLNEKMREHLITSCCDPYLSSLRSRRRQSSPTPLSLTVTTKMILRRIAAQLRSRNLWSMLLHTSGFPLRLRGLVSFVNSKIRSKRLLSMLEHILTSIAVLMPENGPTSSACLNCHSACQCMQETWHITRYSIIMHV